MKATNPRPPASTQPASRSLPADEVIKLIEAGRAAFARYDYEAAIGCFQPALNSKLLNDEPRATLCCLAAESLENLARYREAIEILTEYEQTDTRASLHPVVLGKVYLRLGSAYGYAGDRPKAISFARNALALAEERDDLAETGDCHQVLGRIYRAIGETKFAHDHFQQSLKYHRLTGDKVAIAFAYHGLAMVDISEGNFHSGRNYYDQALKLLGETGPPILFGHIYTNRAVILLLQEQNQEREGTEMLQRAAYYFDKSKNKRLLSITYSNLGYNLLHLGETKRAREALETAITLAREIGERVVQGNSLETLGELALICGQFEESERLAREGITVLQEVSGRWIESQAHLTLGRCYLLQNRHDEATESFNHSLQVATEMDDQRGQAAARLWLVDICLDKGDAEAARRLLGETSAAVEKLANTGLIGHLRELSGRLASAEGNFPEAINLLSQSVSIFEMVSNPYRTAIACYRLGRAYTKFGETAKARTELDKARALFIRLEAAPMLARTHAALERFNAVVQKFPPALVPPPPAPSGQIVRQKDADFALSSNAAMLRLAGAASSRELLLHELSQVIHQELGLEPVIIYEVNPDGLLIPFIWQGCDQPQAESLGAKIERARTAGKAVMPHATLYEFYEGKRTNLTLYLGHPEKALYAPRQFVEPLLRLTELGLELCLLRTQVRTIEGYDLSRDQKDSDLPGMVYQSVAMRGLVAEINKIRSSTVTVLVTGESGTGKEVIARAIHSLSDRHDAPFVAFNCTIAPKEIIDSQLFGHRKGAFTGASADYQGVIRSAAGGTLFLDEVGDLALDVQPKLLRFLQEGEIQPLGENRPVKVSVRVIAATNCDLEKLVAEGRFREDLFYRLNVIRLHMPPLRERRDEIPALVAHMIVRFSTQENKQEITITPLALDLMLAYDWPGNVRQLANEIQRLIALTPSGGEITEDALSPLIRRGSGAVNEEGKSTPGSYYTGPFASGVKTHSIDALLSREALVRPPASSLTPVSNPSAFQPVPGQKIADAVGELETRILTESVARNRGNLRAVARELGLSPRGLYLKLDRYQIKVQRTSRWG